jgi:hypothetical protein
LESSTGTRPWYFIVPERAREQVPGWHGPSGLKDTLTYLHFEGAGARGWKPVIRWKKSETLN